MQSRMKFLAHIGFSVVLFAGLVSAAAAQQTFSVDTLVDDASLVDCNADAANDCSLRGAILAANTSTGTTDRIIFDQSAFLFRSGGTITLIFGELVISDNVIIEQISASAPVTVDADGGSRVFTVNAGVTATLTRLKLINGNVSDRGGAVLNSGNLTVNQSHITGNTASQGGGIYNNGGTLSVNRSTLNSNSAGSGGGAIYNFNGTIGATATVTLTNSTVSNNTAGGGFGGGYFGFADSGTTQLNANNATVAGNIALNGGGIAVTSSTGQSARANLDNTIVGDNMASTGQDVFDNSAAVVPAGLPVEAVVVPGTITSSGYNIVENTNGASIMPQPCNGNLMQTCDQFGVDARLLPLADNNFVFAPTHGLNTAAGNFSPAIDKGDSALNEDQRGQTRPVNNQDAATASGGNNSDIGAFELQNAPTAATVIIGGRVTNAFGKAIARARVSLTDANGDTRRATTDRFGFYRFYKVAVGETYILNATAGRYEFAPLVLSVTEATGELNFNAGG